MLFYVEKSLFEHNILCFLFYISLRTLFSFIFRTKTPFFHNIYCNLVKEEFVYALLLFYTTQGYAAFGRMPLCTYVSGKF